MAVILVAVETCGGESTSSESLVDSGKIDKAMTELGLKTAEKFNGKLDELLTLEMAAKVTENDLNTAEKKYSKVFEDPKTHYVSYGWTNGRKHISDLGFTKIETDKPDLVQLSWVSATSAENFRNMYREITEEDLQNVRDAMDSKIKEGQLDAQSAKMAKEMAEGFMSGNNSREWLDGVADMAVWMERDKSLKVFHKGLTFSVLADVSDDNTENRNIAIALAKLIIKEKL
ncbi:hypothetical protein ACFSKL_04740 [Belliella marina]|uniref:Lipoprotein n=1 Tax=Belliella marina TaxID=1644146 RepID=A0ABW4VKN3_9BACT